MITGKTLIEWGFEPGPWFAEAIELANDLKAKHHSPDFVITEISKLQPAEKIAARTNALPFAVLIEPQTDIERENVVLSIEAMDRLMRVPTVKAGAIMPDTCPAGTIPVGAIVATENAIHPGFHSADICCSMAITVFKRDMDPKHVLDRAQRITHFGPKPRKLFMTTHEHMKWVETFEENQFLKGLEPFAERDFMTQGDGNHFLFVGRVRSTGNIAIVTHHGSRSLGAHLYKRGMAAAKRETMKVARGVDPGASWLVADSQLGQDYWAALQTVRMWTKLNHFAIHDAIARDLGNAVVDRFWNEHNFVFQRSDGLFYHAKGATPSYQGFSPDDDGRTLIPLNMTEPILIARHRDNSKGLGFAPHGAGRNMSRTRYMRDVIGDRDQASILAEVRQKVDARFWLGTPDLSELPDAYKNTDQVVDQIKAYRLADIDDYIDPLGSIMAGETTWQRRPARADGNK